VTATGLGVLVLGEGLTAHQLAGALIIASGLIVIDGRLLARLRSTRFGHYHRNSPRG
jgi:drug/metabolite transporter (DMT)-like permease